METLTDQRKLRIASCLAFLLLSLLLFGSSAPSFRLASILVPSANLSAVGIGATIAPNEFNMLAQEIKQRSTDLSEREQLIAQREAELGKEYSDAIARNNRNTLIILVVVTVLLVVLISVNFYLDHKRSSGRKNDEPHHGELQTRL